jgi:hypothetical protein
MRRAKRTPRPSRVTFRPAKGLFAPAHLALGLGLTPDAALQAQSSPSTLQRFRRAIHRFDSMNSVFTCAAFLVSPRYRALTYPNCRLIIRNVRSTLARMLALTY